MNCILIHIDMNTGTGLPDKVYTMMLTDHKYQLRKDLFDLDALVFDGGQIRQAGIVMPDGSDYLTLLCDGFSEFWYLGSPGSTFCVPGTVVRTMRQFRL